MSAATKVIAHLPLSSAGPWPGESEYRPPGWRSTLTPHGVVARLAEIEEERKSAGWDNAKIEREAALLSEHVALLRQCWVTRARVWRLAEVMVGPPEVDPFWNPWAHTHRLWSGVRLLDGRDGRDGFDLSQWGRVADNGSVSHPDGSLSHFTLKTRGRTGYINGPHGNTSAYVALAARAHAVGHRVAAVVALDGCAWFCGAVEAVRTDTSDVSNDIDLVLAPRDVMSCDVLAVPEGGRMSFEPPPGNRGIIAEQGLRAGAVGRVARSHGAAVADRRMEPARCAGAVRRRAVDADAWPVRRERDCETAHT